jgi:hypothetical protein
MENEPVKGIELHTSKAPVGRAHNSPLKEDSDWELGMILILWSKKMDGWS